MTVHKRLLSGDFAVCGVKLDVRLRGLDYSDTWADDIPFPVNCVSCLMQQPKGKRPKTQTRLPGGKKPKW